MKITENKSGYLPEVFGRNAAFQNLLKNTKTGRSLCVSGLFPVAKANIINALCRAKKKTALCIASDEREAQTLCNDLSCMGLSALVYPVRDYTFLEEISSRSHEYEHQRIKVLLKLLDGDCDVVIACVDAACQLTVPRQVLRDTVIEFSEGKEIPIEKAVRILTLLGYERFDAVDGSGQFSLRGGILDFFMPDSDYPVRAEFWGDEICDLSYFDLETQPPRRVSGSTEKPNGCAAARRLPMPTNSSTRSTASPSACSTTSAATACSLSASSATCASAPRRWTSRTPSSSSRACRTACWRAASTAFR